MRKSFSKVSAITMALVLTAGTLFPVMAQNGYKTGDVANTQAVNTALSNADIIDYSKKGSITIRKYDDMTAASEIGGMEATDTESTEFSGGEQNAAAEKVWKIMK